MLCIKFGPLHAYKKSLQEMEAYLGGEMSISLSLYPCKMQIHKHILSSMQNQYIEKLLHSEIYFITVAFICKVY